MVLSSKVTFLLPALLLTAGSFFLLADVMHFPYISVFRELRYSLLPVFDSALIAGGCYLLFRLLSGRIPHRAMQVLAFFLPAILQLIYQLVSSGNISFEMMWIVEGILFLWAYNLLSGRYMAALTDDTIELKSLLGERLSIPLRSILSLDQKRNLLSILRELSFLNLSRKTGISYRTEDLDEYEVHIFLRAFRSGEMFQAIIERADRCGNSAIRQYKV
jgi:hypothetical protein